MNTGYPSDPAATPDTQPPQSGQAPEENPFNALRRSIPNFPSDAKIAMWKQQAPGARVKLFCPDGRRVFFMRGLSGLELAQIQELPIVKSSKDPDREVQIAACAKCLLWTNVGDLDENSFRTGPAGLAESLFAVIQNLSDFYDPVQLFNCSLEL